MGTHVADVELTDPQPVLPTQGSSGVLALVRWNAVPIGLLSLEGSAPVTAERLRQEIRSRVALPSSAPRRTAAAPPISIVVCTHERPQDLHQCLTALRRFSSAGHQVIVVDNAPSSDRTREVAERFPVTYVCEPRRGLSHARNCGVMAANHQIVAFTDDDAVPDPCWADALAEPFSDPQVVGVTGLVLPIELNSEAQEVFEAYSHHRRSFNSRTFSKFDIAPAAAGVIGIGANMALRRQAVLDVGGFDPRLGAGARTCAGEENDIFARLLDHGGVFRYTPAALAWHRHRRTDEELRQCVFGYGVGVYAFLTKRVVEHRDWQALSVGVRWLVGPFIRAVQGRVSGLVVLPPRLLLLEATGAVVGVVRFLREPRPVPPPASGR